MSPRTAVASAVAAPAHPRRRRRSKPSQQAEEGARYVQFLSLHRVQARLSAEELARCSGVPRHRLSRQNWGLFSETLQTLERPPAC